MDITLERILSLIPKKPDGKFVHGAKKQFADALGLSHNLVTMWEKGQSQSYRNYVYEIAAKYDVSVAWLKGETDDMGGTGQFQGDNPSGASGAAAAVAGVVGATLLPGAAAIAAIDTVGLSVLKGKKKQPASQNGDGLSSRDLRLIEWFRSLPPEKQKAILSLGDGPEDLSD